MKRLACLLVLLALPAAAQDLRHPALYDVAGVEADDVLNLRAGPTVDQPVIGTLAPDAEDVEVMRINESGTWGLVARPEGRGWASLAFLQRQPAFEEGTLPRPLYCSGTEPFWSLSLLPDGQATLSEPGSPDVPLTETWSGKPEGRLGTTFGITLSAPDGRATAIVEREMCSDGMSDRPYGFAVEVLLQGGTAPRLLSGCCSLAR